MVVKACRVRHLRAHRPGGDSYPVAGLYLYG